MSADYYINVETPVIVKWNCYACGHPIDLHSESSLERHRKCAVERNNELQIPLELTENSIAKLIKP